MATRRMKKRTKKQLHHGRRKTNRHRHTRRQRGGAKITLCERSGYGFFATGIAITYDTDSQMYTIGNHPYGNLKTMSRYNDALSSLEIMRGEGSAPQLSDDKYVVLNQGQFDRFKHVHCQGSTKPECDAISRFRVPSAVAPAASAASAASAAEFDKRCVINTYQVSFLGTQFRWTNHEIPLEITDFRFAQKNKNLMDWLNANVEKIVFFKAERILRVMTKKSALEDTYDAIFLSIHFKKTKDNYCALAKFKDNDAFNQLSRIYDKTSRYPHFLLYPNNQPGTNNTTDQANVATCYIGKYEALPTGITCNDFAVVIDKFVEYKKAGCDEDLARTFYMDYPDVLALFEHRGSLSAQMSRLSISP